MTAPLFSIITVSYNAISRLERTYESLGLQNFDNFEWLVVDAGSQDGTKDFLRTTFADWTSEPDHGIYDGMNKGIERAQAMYLLFLNAGDTFAHSSVLSDIATYISERDLVPDFVYGDSYEEVHGSAPIYKEARPYTKIDLGMFTHHQAMFYRREAIGDLRYSRRFRIAGDYDFTARFLKTAQNVTYFPEPICLFEIGGISQHNTGLGRREQKFIRRNLGLCGPYRSHFITMGQSFAAFVKTVFPHFYWSIRGR